MNSLTQEQIADLNNRFNIIINQIWFMKDDPDYKYRISFTANTGKHSIAVKFLNDFESTIRNHLNS